VGGARAAAGPRRRALTGHVAAPLGPRRRGSVVPVPTEDDVRRTCLGMVGVTERQSWGQPAWFARTLMARIWEPGVVTVKTDEREALAASDPGTFYWTPHHERSPSLVLVRLERVDPTELDELLTESYRLAGGTTRRLR
jgi:hypothetical protein